MRPTAQKFLKANEILFSQGDTGDCAYIIEKGRVQIFFIKDKEEIPINILGEGEIFGEMSLIDNQNRSASAKAIEECTLLYVTREQLMERVQNADNIVKLLVRVLLKRMRQNTSLLTGEKNTSPIQKFVLSEEINSNAVTQIKFENEIFEAYHNKEFEIYLQPIVQTSDKKIIGVESLLRWISPSKGTIPTGTFIEVIENSSMILPIGYWIIEESFAHLKAIFDKISVNDRKSFMLSLNISGKQFNDSDLIAKFEEIRIRYGLSQKNIKIEITERVMLDGIIAIETLRKFRSLGYGISIDDFGTGFSSLQYLSQMPVTHLKLDRSFISKMTTDPKTKTIVQAIIFLAHGLGFETVAEGVETEEEFEVIKNLQSDYVQGYLTGRPIPLQELLKRL